MDKVELVEQTKTLSKMELKVPFSVLFSILKEKFPEQLKNVYFTCVEYSLNNDLNSEEFLSCVWEVDRTTDKSTELEVSKLTSEKLTEMARLAALEEINSSLKKV